MLGWKLCFIIKQISCFKIMSTFLGISTRKVFGSFATTSLLSPMFTAIIIKIRLNVAFFWWFYYADPKDVVFVWFLFLVCMNYVLLSFVLIINEDWLIVCLELIFLTLFLFLPICQLLVVLWVVNQQLLLTLWVAFFKALIHFFSNSFFQLLC